MPQSIRAANRAPVYNTLTATLVALVISVVGGTPALAQDATTKAPARIQAPETITLSADDVERFIAAMAEMRPLGVRLAGSIGSDPSGMAQMMEAMMANSAALDVLRRHGFDSAGFQRTGYSVMMAYAAGAAQDAGVDITAIRGLLSLMQGQISAEQYRIIEQQMLNAEQSIQNQPPENVDLVRSYKARIDAIVYSAPGPSM